MFYCKLVSFFAGLNIAEPLPYFYDLFSFFGIISCEMNTVSSSASFTNTAVLPVIFFLKRIVANAYSNASLREEGKITALSVIKWNKLMHQ